MSFTSRLLCTALAILVFITGHEALALEVGLRGEFGGDTEIVSGGASLRVDF